MAVGAGSTYRRKLEQDLFDPEKTVTAALRLEAMLLKMPRNKRERLLEEVAIAEPTFASLVRAQLPLVATRKSRPAARRTTAPARQLARA